VALVFTRVYKQGHVQTQVQVLFLFGFSHQFPAAMPGDQVLTGSLSVHPVGALLRLRVETRPVVPRFPAVSAPYCFWITQGC
jgi:hypothetical protein